MLESLLRATPIYMMGGWRVSLLGIVLTMGPNGSPPGLGMWDTLLEAIGARANRLQFKAQGMHLKKKKLGFCSNCRSTLPDSAVKCRHGPVYAWRAAGDSEEEKVEGFAYKTEARFVCKISCHFCSTETNNPIPTSAFLMELQRGF